MAGTTHDHVIKLLQNLQYNCYSGKITKQQLKFGISRLELNYEYISFTQRYKICAGIIVISMWSR